MKEKMNSKMNNLSRKINSKEKKNQEISREMDCLK